MRWDSRGTIALLVSALVGVSAGVVFGLTSGSPGPSNADPDGARQSEEATPQDPLGLGATLVNLDCTSQKILVVGYGETHGALENAVSANLDADVKYLDTAQSCNTLYGPEDEPTPKYVVYLGPFDTSIEPCGLRMSVGHKGDVVTSLKPNQNVHVPCLCVLRPADFPVLSVGMNTSTRVGIYVRAMQQLLLDMGLTTANRVTGYYDRHTEKIIVRLQKLNALNPDKYGIVERSTWLQLRDRGCVGFDF